MGDIQESGKLPNRPMPKKPGMPSVNSGGSSFKPIKPLPPPPEKNVRLSENLQQKALDKNISQNQPMFKPMPKAPPSGLPKPPPPGLPQTPRSLGKEQSKSPTINTSIVQKPPFPQAAPPPKRSLANQCFPQKAPSIKKGIIKNKKKGINLSEIEIKDKDVISENEKKRKSKTFKTLWVLLLLLILNGGGLVAYEAIKEDKSFRPKTFYDNVSIHLSELEILNGTDLMANSMVDIGELGVRVVVPDGLSDQTLYDILAFAVKIDIKYQKPTTTDMLNCNDMIGIKFANIDEVYEYNSLTTTQDGYSTVAKDQYVYFNKVLEPGDEYKIIDKIKIAESASNEFANNSIYINIQVFAVFPRRDKIKEEDDSYLKDAPEGWVTIVHNKGAQILIERGFGFEDLETAED